MELELSKGLDLDVSDTVKNATTTVNEAFNNTVEKCVDNLDVEKGMVSKIKEGLQKFNMSEVAAKTIDTAMKSTLKSVAGVKAKTINNVKTIGKAIRDSNLKQGLKGILNIGIDSIKGIPKTVKNLIKDGADLMLGDTFDDELQKVMTKQRNTLSRINKKCESFEKAFNENDEKNMKKYANSISKDLEKVSLISDTINRGKEIVNRYELLKNKGSTELSSIEQELLKKIV